MMMADPNSNWKEKIINAFTTRYFDSACNADEERDILRIRSAQFFPSFDSAGHTEKEAYLEAAELLEQKGIVKLTWEKWGRGERLKTLSCENFDVLFAEAGKPYPKPEVEKVRAMLDAKIAKIKGAPQAAESIIDILESLSLNFGIREIGQGLDQKTMEDFTRFLELSYDPAKPKKITIRALSILLYNDSKRLEDLTSLCSPLLSRVQKTLPLQHLALPERSYPEAIISGKLVFELKNSAPPLVNAQGLILNIPLESAEAFASIRPFPEKSERTVLTIENKETFFALGSPSNHDESESTANHDCFLYVGGYPNRAAAILIKTLAASGFTFFHAGDLDPDGILILQHIGAIAEKPVTPVRMDAATFDQYRPWARTLSKPMLRQIQKIREETKAISGLAGLLQRIEETSLGVEQEIVDYGSSICKGGGLLPAPKTLTISV